MEDIEYLEEYEDLVLPALNSAAAAAAASSVSSKPNNKNQQNQKANDEGDDSSSSLDQDIFNCLFDDNSDDDEEDLNEYQRSESALRTKSASNESYETLHDNIDDIGEKIIQKVEISRQEPINKYNTVAKPSNKITSSTTKPKTFITKTGSTTTIHSNTSRAQNAFANKPKSIATVRPTVQNQQKQQNSQKKTNLIQTTLPTFSQQQKPTSSTASTSSRSVQLPVVARKPLSSTATSSLSTSTLVIKKAGTSLATPNKSTTVLKKITKRPATIVRPEKIVIKDPANDPLDLDDLSVAGSENYSLSDISGETYNSISEFDDDDDDDSNDVYYSGDDDYYEEDDDEDDVISGSNSHVIELSNDSSGTTSNLEEFRASTPPPVISDDSNPPSSSSSGFELHKTPISKPYRHPQIIESVLRKGEKPKLLELLQTHNLLDETVDNNVADNIVIDITASRENLVDSFDSLHVAASATATATVTSTPLANNKPNTTDRAIKNPTSKHSTKTNKKKTKKKRVTNMDYTNDYRDLKSPGGATTDSDLSAVEELLEESYAAAMKRKRNVALYSQELGAEMEIAAEQEVTATETQHSEGNKQKLAKPGVVIDYDDNALDGQSELKEIQEGKMLEEQQSEKEQKEIVNKTENQKQEQKEESETKNKEEIADKAMDSSLELKQKADAVADATIIQQQDKTNASDTTNTRKHKRFRNLLTPELPGESTGAPKSIDDVDDFKGFEEVTNTEENTELETKELETQDKLNVVSAAFKSPTNAHKPSHDKPKEASEKSCKDNSKDAKDKRKRSRSSSKDKSCRESSRDKSSRESSKDRSRESSKDRSKQSNSHDRNSRHHHKDHRKSSDSKESSKSRESSRSRDPKETYHTKTDTKKAAKTGSVNKEETSKEVKEKSTEKKDLKPAKETDKNPKEVNKYKDQLNKKDTKTEKSSSENKDKKPPENEEKSKEKLADKSLSAAARDSKSSTPSSSSRDSSKDRKSLGPTQNLNKSSTSCSNISKTEKSEFPKKPQATTDLNKSQTTKMEANKPKSTTAASTTNENPKDVSKSLPTNKADTDKEKEQSKSSDSAKDQKPGSTSTNDNKVTTSATAKQQVTTVKLPASPKPTTQNPNDSKQNSTVNKATTVKQTDATVKQPVANVRPPDSPKITHVKQPVANAKPPASPKVTPAKQSAHNPNISKQNPNSSKVTAINPAKTTEKQPVPNVKPPASPKIAPAKQSTQNPVASKQNTNVSSNASPKVTPVKQPAANVKPPAYPKVTAAKQPAQNPVVAKQNANVKQTDATIKQPVANVKPPPSPKVTPAKQTVTNVKPPASPKVTPVKPTVPPAKKPAQTPAVSKPIAKDSNASPKVTTVKPTGETVKQPVASVKPPASPKVTTAKQTVQSPVVSRQNSNVSSNASTKVTTVNIKPPASPKVTTAKQTVANVIPPASPKVTPVKKPAQTPVASKDLNTSKLSSKTSEDNKTVPLKEAVDQKKKDAAEENISDKEKKESAKSEEPKNTKAVCEDAVMCSQSEQKTKTNIEEFKKPEQTSKSAKVSLQAKNAENIEKEATKLKEENIEKTKEEPTTSKQNETTTEAEQKEDEKSSKTAETKIEEKSVELEKTKSEANNTNDSVDSKAQNDKENKRVIESNTSTSKDTVKPTADPEAKEGNSKESQGNSSANMANVVESKTTEDKLKLEETLKKDALNVPSESVKTYSPKSLENPDKEKKEKTPAVSNKLKVADTSARSVASTKPSQKTQKLANTSSEDRSSKDTTDATKLQETSEKAELKKKNDAQEIATEIKEAKELPDTCKDPKIKDVANKKETSKDSSKRTRKAPEETNVAETSKEVDSKKTKSTEEKLEPTRTRKTKVKLDASNVEEKKLTETTVEQSSEATTETKQTDDTVSKDTEKATSESNFKDDAETKIKRKSNNEDEAEKLESTNAKISLKEDKKTENDTVGKESVEKSQVTDQKNPTIITKSSQENKASSKSGNKETTAEEPRKARSHADLKGEEDKVKAEASHIETTGETTLTQDDLTTQTEKTPRTTRKRRDAKAEEGKESNVIESADISLTPVGQGQDATETTETSTCKETCATQDESTNQTIEEDLEPRKTRKRGNLKAEIEQETKEITQVEQTEEKSTGQDVAKTQTDEHTQPRKTRKRGEVGKEATEIAQTESQDEEQNLEPIKTRKRANKTVNETTEMNVAESQEEKGSLVDDTKNLTQEENLGMGKTRSHAEEKGPTESQEENSLTHKEEPIKTRKRRDLIAEKAKETTESQEQTGVGQETTKADVQEEKLSLQDVTLNPTEEEHPLKPRKGRKRAGIKAELGKEATGTEAESQEETDSLHDDSRNITHEEHVEPRKRRTRGPTVQAESHEKEEDTSQDDSKHEPGKTRKQADIKGDTKTETNAIPQAESSKENKLQKEDPKEQKEDHASINTKVTTKENTEMSQREASSEKSCTPDITTTQTEALPIKKRPGRPSKLKKILAQTKLPQVENKTSTADENAPPANTACKDITSSEIEEPSISETLSKSSLDNLNFEADMSGSESSITSSNSDNTLRRTLRKRASESPFPENDKKKKLFKEPPPALKPTTAALITTPKGTVPQLDKPTIIGSTTIKRIIKPTPTPPPPPPPPTATPPAETEEQSSSKKPKLDTSRKSTRFRNLHDDCLVEEELPVVTADEQDCLPEPTIAVQETSQNKTTEKVEQPLTQEKAKDVKQLPVKVLQKEVLGVQGPKTSANKEILQVTKSSVSTVAKVALPVTKPSDTKAAVHGTKAAVNRKSLQGPKQPANKQQTLQASKQTATKDPLSKTAKVTVKKTSISQEIKPKTKSDKTVISKVSNAQETPPVRGTTDKANVNTTTSPSKSASCTAVLSFSDWLKTKKQNAAADKAVVNVEVKSTESTPEQPMRPSKVKAKITETPLESKPTEEIQEKTLEVAETPAAETTTMICHNKEKSLSSTLEDKQEHKATDANVSSESMNVSQQLDNSLLQPSENQLQNALQQQQKQQKRKGRQKKVKRLDIAPKRPVQKRASPLAVKKCCTPTTTIISPPRNKIKKTEIDMLIESMSKEMKEGGISDLLNTQTHVKRPRLTARKNLNESKDPLNNSNTTATTSSLEIASESTTNDNASGALLNKSIPKVFEFSENSEIVTTTMPAGPKEPSKSPTKRKIQQHPAKSKKPATTLATPHGINTPDISTDAEQTILQENPKVLHTKSRKSLNIKEVTAQVATENVATTGVVKSRKSMPLTTKVPNVVVASARKSLVIPAASEDKLIQRPSSVFKAPKQLGLTTLLNQMPSVDSIKKLCDGDNKRSDGRLKIHHSASRLNTIKCRKLRVRLNRSLVRKYLNTVNNRKNRTLPRTEEHLEVHVPVEAAAECSAVATLPIIEHNSASNLRIDSVVDAAALLNVETAAVPAATCAILTTPATATPAQTNVIANTDILLTSTSTSSPISIPIPEVQQQQQPYIVNTTTAPPLTSLPATNLLNVADGNETIELKNEFMDENPSCLINDAILPDTPTLLARAQSITEAAQHALSSSITPTDIRLLGTDSAASSYVASFGVTPTALDNRGTCMYTFLHPAKYNRNHSNVLLDYCCPNLDGPMPAIDPTRIHAQVQVPVIELPSAIVLTTKVVTRADLESGATNVPAIIRKKAEKIRKNLATHHKMAVATTAATALQASTVVPVMAPTRPTLPPTINALTKQLPATTTITAKIRTPEQQQQQQPPAPTSTSASATTSTIPRSTVISVMPKASGSHMMQLSNIHKSSLRSSLRRFDVLLKQLVQPFESLSFVERHRIIEALIATGKFSAKDLDHTLVLMEEYIKQTLLLTNDPLNQPMPTPTSAILSSTSYIATQSAIASTSLPSVQMPQLQPSPNILASSVASTTATSYARQFEQIHNKAVRKVQSRSRNTSVTTAGAGSATGTVLVKQRQVPIYDTDRNIIGYQMQMMTPMSSIPAYTKSTMSTHTGAIMSTSLDSSSNKITSYSVSKRPMKRPAQESPRVFYTTPPLKTSTPKALTNPHMCPATQQAKNGNNNNSNTIAKKTQQGSIVTTVRSGASSASGSSETITTTTMATVKRVTRSTATGSKIIIVSKSNQSSEETILPDGDNQEQHAEIKNEEDMEDFLG